MGAPGWLTLSPSILMFILIHIHHYPPRFWPSCCTSSLWRIRKHLISTAIPKRKPTQACFWSQGEHADSQPVSIFPSKALSAQLPKSVQQAACWAWRGFFLRLVTLGLGMGGRWIPLTAEVNQTPGIRSIQILLSQTQGICQNALVILPCILKDMKLWQKKDPNSWLRFVHDANPWQQLTIRTTS